MTDPTPTTPSINLRRPDELEATIKFIENLKCSKDDEVHVCNAVDFLTELGVLGYGTLPKEEEAPAPA